tara:strand:- start:1467 stop:2198 length:732 start_codon:yes stop_codon:yes gene_type:complete
MPKQWVMDKNYEWEEIEAPIKAKRRPNEVKKPTIGKSKRGKDPQQKIAGFCTCGRKAGSYRKNPNYCSRYCYLFENTVAEGYKKKTLYECWRGTGKYSYNPKYPKLTVQCVWCNEDFELGRAQKDENRYFCGQNCSRQANRSAVGTSARVGSKKIGDRVRVMRILRHFKDRPLTSAEISEYWNKWFRNTSSSYHKVANLCKILEARGLVQHFQSGSEKRTYIALDFTTPLKTLFGEEEILNNR